MSDSTNNLAANDQWPSITNWSSPIGRLAYFGHTVLFSVLYLIALSVFSDYNGEPNALGWIILLLVIVSSTASTCRRLKDLGRTRWMVLLQLIPLVNIGLWIYLQFFRGQLALGEQWRGYR